MAVTLKDLRKCAVEISDDNYRLASSRVDIVCSVPLLPVYNIFDAHQQNRAKSATLERKVDYNHQAYGQQSSIFMYRTAEASL